MNQYQARRLFDWRFLVSLALLASVSWVIVVGINAQRDSAARSHRIGVLLVELKAQQAENQLNTTLFAANQRELLDYTAALAERQTALLRYLHNHGIKLPERFLTGPPVPAPAVSATVRPAKKSAVHKSVKRPPKVHPPGRALGRTARAHHRHPHPHH